MTEIKHFQLYNWVINFSYMTLYEGKIEELTGIAEYHNK